ncbi:Fic family protein [Neptuniibacter pectenicola]|uniref:Fic family protein n=1 Tax=Neptuniibacter pectenicola TaxID=1806669 RepID=UPI0030ECEA68
MKGITPYLPLDPKLALPLKDKAIEVYKRSARLEASVPPGLKSAVTHLLRFVNSYYSNKIEGNNTKPADVIRAQHANEEELDPAIRDDHKEVVSHLIAQKFLASNQPSASEVSSAEFVQWIHELFFQDLSEQARTLVLESTGEQFIVEAGQFREQQVVVGRHLPPEGADLAKNMEVFHRAYRLDWIHGDERLLAAAASHHRLLWIHPFLDGNGRVTRLFTDVYMQLAGVDGYGLWSVSRGFSRSIEQYKAALAAADKPRGGDLDGRGQLSDKGMLKFQHYFLDTCLEQIDYLSSLLCMGDFDKRMAFYVSQRVAGVAVDVDGKPLPKWRPETINLFRAVIAQGGVLRTDVPAITGLGETVSRNLVKQLMKEHWLVGDEKRPLKLEIPFEGISTLFPHLW